MTIPPALMQTGRVPSPAKEFMALAGLPRQALMPTGGAGDFALAPLEVVPDQEGVPQYPLLRRFGQTSYLSTGLSEIRARQKNRRIFLRSRR